MALFAGWDIGTNGVRLLAIDENLNIRFEAEADYDIGAPRPGWAEQDPEEVVVRCRGLLSQLVQEAGTAARLP